MNILVAYFTATGVTERVARKLADVTGAELYKICPAVTYSTKDLDWTNSESRSSVEMKDKSCRPKLTDKWAPVARADVIFLGFPVWWYREPSVIDSFLEAYDFTGKKIIPFVTSGGSDIGEEAPARMAELTGAEILEGKKFAAGASHEELKAWAEKVIG